MVRRGERREELGTSLAQVHEGSETDRVVEDSSQESVLGSLRGFCGPGQVGEPVGRPGRSRVYPWRETLPGEGPGGTGGSLHLDLLQRLVELLLRVGADKPTVEVVKYFLVLQRTTYSHSIVVSDEHWLGL